MNSNSIKDESKNIENNFQNHYLRSSNILEKQIINFGNIYNKNELNIESNKQDQSEFFLASKISIDNKDNDKVDDNNLGNFFSFVEEKYFTQYIDHFSSDMKDKKFEQRYMIDNSALLIEEDTKVSDIKGTGNKKKYKYPKCIFFYAGNEAPVTKYINSTGLMFENAKEFSALIVFAEHRYWGKSIPSKDIKYLTYEQAMEDYVTLIGSLKKNISLSTSEYIIQDNINDNIVGNEFSFRKKQDIPVIVFGGSYGGMLAAWMRMTYPSVIFASVASSAPILAFPGVSDFYEKGGSDYWKIVTKNAGKKCARQVNDSLKALQRMINWHRVGPHPSEYLGICHQSKPLSWKSLNLWVAYGFDDMSMVNYPFSSNYISDDPSIYLPANPVQVACEELKKGFESISGNSENDEENDNDEWWTESSNFDINSYDELGLFNSEKKIRALGKAMGVFYNSTKTKKCFDPPPEDDTYDGQWDYLWCDVQMPQETYFEIKGPPNDMFLKMDPINWEKINDHCSKTWGVKQNPSRITNRYGSISDIKMGSISRIIFTNGDLDPWSSGGIKKGDFGFIKSRTDLPIITIKGGAHHVDLMFSRKDDPAEFKIAREEILSHLRNWLNKK